MPEQPRRYRAFISYSQKDKSYARRLHRELESYRLPKGIVGAGVDVKTGKLGRIFRDDEEMGAATDLGAALQGAIADARNLIVVCSPYAAKSRWVNEEIIHFKRTGRAEHIFAVIVAGTPNSGDEKECFPPALRFELGPDGALSDQRTEPLAVNLHRESFARALVRLAAGLAETEFDSLWKRERRRARERVAGVTLTVGLIALMLGAALTQNLWRPKLELYWRYTRYAHSTEELLAAQPGTTFQDCRETSTDCPTMVIVPEGRFTMGSAVDDAEARAEERPQREVSVPRLAVSQTEITVAQWNACTRSGGCAGYEPNGFPGNEGEARPVVDVSWYDAKAYVQWLSQATGNEYRLLTEAEWEYSARARSIGQFSWGNDLPVCDLAAPNGAAFGARSGLESGCEQQRPWNVASFAANAFGLYDMHGNAEEWVEDCWSPYDPSTRDASAVLSASEMVQDPFGNEITCIRVLRGGAWQAGPVMMRSAYRDGNYPSVRNINYGIRVARTIAR